MERRRRRAAIAALAVMIAGSSILNLGSYYHPLDPRLGVVRYVAVFAGALVALLCGWHRTRRAIPIAFLGRLLLTEWMVFGTFVIASDAVNFESTMLVSGLWMTFAVPALFFNQLPRVLGETASHSLILCLFWCHIPYLAISFVLDPALKFRYLGIFGDPNQVGLVAVVASTAVFAYSVKYLQQKHRSWLYAVSIVGAHGMLLAIILMSGSRTSLAAWGVLFCLSSGSLMKRYRWKLLILLPLLVVTLAASAEDWLDDLPIVAKQNSLAQKDNLLNERLAIWRQTIEERSMFGHGSNYFLGNVGMTAHNTLVHVLGTYGLLAAAILCLVAPVTILAAFRYAVKAQGTDPYALAPLLVVCTFWSISITEGLLGSIGTGLNLAFFLAIGISIRPLRIFRLRQVPATPRRMPRLMDRVHTASIIPNAEHRVYLR